MIWSLRRNVVILSLATILCSAGFASGEPSDLKEPNDLCNTALHEGLDRKTQLKLMYDSFNEAELVFDDHGLLVPHLEKEVLRGKIAADFFEVKERLRQAVSEGKHIVYLQGSFDLVHSGHAAMIIHAARNYQIKNSLTRDDLYVVVLADSDDFILNTKKHKHESNGGTEEIMRPVQSMQNVGVDEGGDHPRLLDLATLPVDLVALTPAPSRGEMDLLTDPRFKEAMVRVRPWMSHIVEEAKERLDDDLPEHSEKELYRLTFSAMQMIDAIEKGSPESVVDAFELGHMHFGSHWHVSGWQFLLHLFFEIDNLDGANVVRVQNIRDMEYIRHVSAWTLATGFENDVISGAEIRSTTDLIKDVGAAELLEAKKHSYHD